MITFTNLADSDHSHFAQNLFEEAFPEQERPPFSIIRQRDAGKFHFLVSHISYFLIVNKLCFLFLLQKYKEYLK